MVLLLASCQQQNSHKMSDVFSEEEDTTDTYELSDIQEAGTVIAGTLSGPDTYYEWRGHGMGLQFLLADAFAQSIGARLDMQVARDTAQLQQWLKDGTIDFIALSYPNTSKGKESIGWKAHTATLQKAIRQWWNPNRQKEVLAQFTRRVRTGTRMHRKPMWRNRSRGIISDYDDLFRRHASRIGWDWKLMAAQCYQESGFDPRARSWAGAEGLMQIVPSTARQLGLSPSAVYTPEANIAAAARYLQMLEGKFSGISDRRERIKFVLASYNGGATHIQDAQALARKYGGNPHSWSDVSRWVLLLQYPRYYRDSAVKAGYMRGSETVGYVRNIQSHWENYSH